MEGVLFSYELLPPSHNNSILCCIYVKFPAFVDEVAGVVEAAAVLHDRTDNIALKLNTISTAQQL